jgi:hypothetical protein
LFLWGPTEGQSVQIYTPHKVYKTTPRTKCKKLHPAQNVQYYNPHKVYETTPRTIEHHKGAIRLENQTVNFNTLEKVFRNLEKRIPVCLDVKGYQLKHRLWAGPVLHHSRYMHINF